MAHPINMPQVGQDIETAVITEWKVKEGDRVDKGDVVALVESDKAVFEVEVFESGTILKLLFHEDEEACVLEPIAIIGEQGEKLEDLMTSSPEDCKERSGFAVEQQSFEDEPSPGEVRIFASPLARRLAAEMGVDLESVEGSGPQGRIIKEDILKAVEDGKFKKDLRSAAVTDTRQPVAPGVVGTVIPFNRMRQSIADRMTRSVQTIPHFYLSMKADVTEFLAWRVQHQAATGNKISVNDLVIKATATALVRFPKINAHVKADSMVLCKDVNIGVAVALDDGLIVPVIPDTPAMGLAEIADKVREISDSARKGTIAAGPAGTFTVSNLGMLGVSEFLPIINPPETGILGVGTIENQLILLQDGKVGTRNVLSLTLGCDHRAVDGYYAGEFLRAIREEIEKIELWQLA
jgi:pyruvate dehydrogenase E2 component (dihydrolipoyllysine-residue acetyltransferase)